MLRSFGFRSLLPWRHWFILSNSSVGSESSHKAKHSKGTTLTDKQMVMQEPSLQRQTHTVSVAQWESACPAFRGLDLIPFNKPEKYWKEGSMYVVMCQNTIRECSCVSKGQENKSLVTSASSKTQTRTWNVFHAPLRCRGQDWVGFSSCSSRFYGNTCFCHMWLFPVLEPLSQTTLLSLQDIPCLMLWIKLAFVWDFTPPQF